MLGMGSRADNTTATNCTFGWRWRWRCGGGGVGVLTYPRCAATSGTCRIRERRNPTDGASHFTPSRRTCLQPPPENRLNRGNRRGEDRGGGTTRGRLPFPDPRDSLPTFPPLTAPTRRQLPACDARDARVRRGKKLGALLRAAQLKMRAGAGAGATHRRRYGQGILMSPAAVCSQPGEPS